MSYVIVYKRFNIVPPEETQSARLKIDIICGWGVLLSFGKC